MKTSKFFRGKGKYLLIGLAIYATLFIVLMVIRGDILANNETTQLWFGELRKDNDFLTSYLASSLDSLIFFVFIGVAAILISVKDPSNERLFQKINYIFPQTQRDTVLSKYIQDGISTLACIATDVKRSITVQELSPCNNYVKIDIKGRTHIKNIFNNHDFVSDNMKYSMQADPVDFCDIWAEMLEASITTDVSKPISSEQHLNGTIILNKNKPKHTEAFPVTLAPNAVALYYTHGWFWQSQEDHLKLNASRFVEKSIYNVKNDLDKPLVFIVESNRVQVSLSEKLIKKIKSILSNASLSEDDKGELIKLVNPSEDKSQLETKEHTIQPGKSCSIFFDNIVPSDTIKFIFKVPEIKTMNEEHK